MAENLSPPPVGQPFDINGRPNPAWTQYFEQQYRILGRGTGTATLNVDGSAHKLTRVTVTSGSGVPEASVAANPGTFYTDTDTGIVYVKESGDQTVGWRQLV